MMFWRSRGLAGLPKAHVVPTPDADEAAEISLCFEVVAREKAEFILLIGVGGIESLSRLCKPRGALPPVACLDQSLMAHADVCFHVNDPNSWTALARCLQGAESSRMLVRV